MSEEEKEFYIKISGESVVMDTSLEGAILWVESNLDNIYLDITGEENE